MEDSILKSVKNICGVSNDNTAFDFQLLTHINTVFTHLTQLGIGPEDGFEIEDATALWTTYFGSTPRWNGVKSYTWLKVRMMFDPPSTSFVISSMEKQLAEMEWRLLTERELTDWTSPEPIEFTDTVIDGGTP